MSGHLATAALEGTANLCYLKAGQVDGPVGRLAGVRLSDRDDATLGVLDGVLLDAAARQVRYFVVQSDTQRFLLPVESGLTMENEGGRRRLVAQSADLDLRPFDPDAFRPFSEEDALSAMFGA